MPQDIFIIGDYQSLVSKLSDQRARKYLFYGFNMRALQIKETKFQLSQTIEKAGGKNLSPYDICHVNIFLNAFYLIMHGALDNLAWTMQHEFSIIDGANESDKSRNYIGLFHNKFRNGLKCIDSETVDSLMQYDEWFSELKKFRDPAAHRMPLYCAPGVVTSEQQDQYKAAADKLSAQNYMKDPSSYMEAQYELSRVGNFQPIFTSFGESDDILYPLLRTIELDYHPFWEVANCILGFFEKNLTTRQPEKK
jgi:hypothetical protein